METKRVKNISGVDLAIVDIGMVKAGESIEVPASFHNANFEEVKKETQPDIPKGKKHTK